MTEDLEQLRKDAELEDFIRSAAKRYAQTQWGIFWSTVPKFDAAMQGKTDDQ